MKFGYWADLTGVKLGDDGTAWLQAMPVGEYKHPVHGKIDFSETRLKRFADGVNNKVVGTDLDIDFEHKARTGEAAGWVQAAEVRGPAGLWLGVKFTEDAAAAIKKGKWRYFSPEYEDKWTHPKTGVQHEDVLRGGGLTNRPFLKDILPVNLSELSFNVDGEDNKEEGVDPKKLRAHLKLAEDATDAEVDAALDKAAEEAKKTDPPAPEPDKTFTVTQAQLDEALKKLTEAKSTDPTIAAMTELLKAQGTQLQELTKTIARQGTTRKLDDAKTSTTALSPVAKEALSKVALGEDTAGGLDEFLKLFAEGKAIVTLGENGASSPNGNGEGDSAEKRFLAAVKKTMGENKGMDEPTAMGEVAKADGKLFEDYRSEATSFRI